MKRSTFVIITLLFTTLFTFGQVADFNDSIDNYFREIKANTAHYKDLWDLDLYGSILLVDPGSRKIYANFPDSVGILKKDGNMFTGLLPAKINIANTSIHWNGRSWAMIILPLPYNKQDRLNILSHELFHLSQPSLGFHIPNADNNHLDQRDGRVYLRLELEALRLALISGTKSETCDHLTNAMFFRKTRYSLFNGASLSENLMELNEGLAEYTGIMMSGRSAGETTKYFEQKLTEFQNWESFVRSFAYVTTPLYGFILSKSVKDWNKHVTDTTDLTEFFIRNFSLSVPVNLCSECMNQYGFEKILTEEIKREKE